MMASDLGLVYYEYSWSILSTIGIINVLYSITVIGITSLSPVTIIPLITSAAGAVANGLCFYAFYADYPIQQQVVASAFADIFWLIQEAGLSFYSYVILRRVLRHRARILFLSLFWLLIAIIAILRLTILATRVRLLLSDTDDLQPLVNYLHIGYFSAIAAIEVVSAGFLIRKFARARKTSNQFAMTTGLFSYLMRSTEIRLALLAIIGITRAATYSFQASAQSATSIASEVDRFVYTLECMFPAMFLYVSIILLSAISHIEAHGQTKIIPHAPPEQGHKYTNTALLRIDILASKVVFSKGSREYSSHSHGVKYPRGRGGAGGGVVDERDISMYPMSRHDGTRIEVHGGGESPDRAKQRRNTGSSTERIINPADTPSAASSAISKTVEFEMRESIAVPEGTHRRG
ncbi:uncharacterized protein MKZ38_004510 [Zalerion maritima]|uniref:Uncharacterized protein n=1 Tax=Zalerion maritima TaxID=339359 RepID=A0AAD5RSA4_9PEZI|nr:uncharacterized protein MKZ38_004510 [Zalerion maritima]